MSPPPSPFLTCLSSTGPKAQFTDGGAAGSLAVAATPVAGGRESGEVEHVTKLE